MILLLEDEIVLCEMIEEFLISKGFEVYSVDNADDALEQAMSGKYELFIFDVKVPLGNGFSILQELRSHKITTPAIFTTSLNTIADLQEGYESGCDDYLKKPFDLEELYLRIQKLLGKKGNEAIDFGNGVKFDMNQKLLYRGDSLLPLTNKENELLAMLIENKGQYLTLEEISYRLWGYEEPSFASLRVYIKNIRQQIGKDCIHTKRGLGYCYE
ncbi:response regulator transcription factor [uncultured Helicobacter sp.]|uniref:response regulator transcription factor n=1 Tax=uncultured Helicobacter sp. TaxID=175537 RepID=UPI00260D0B5C|nr:response regulator transcription factor [uncultured Helicobacter sp.]